MDQIVSVQQNNDGSFTFGFIFDNGSGITGSTIVQLPAPTGTPAVLDSSGNIVTPAIAPVPYTLDNAKTAVISIASTQKAAWLANMNASGIIGDVVL